MTDTDSERYLAPYREALKLHGPTFRATLWANPDAQRLRFDVMIEMVAFEGCRILDLGCGRGDFAVRLNERNVSFGSLIGIDAMEEMIETARGRRLRRCEFHCLDVLCEPDAMAEWNPDYVCISGTLNTMDQDTARKVVQGAFEAAAQGVIFNFLSNRAHERWEGKDLTPATRFDTLAWLDWAMTLSSRVVFAQDYMDGHDATILIRHDTA